ncbi:MAG: hypothetical protein LBD36_02745 [Holosporales bacterium]|nr:hypothetical protein [Holosporales bacterium]
MLSILLDENFYILLSFIGLVWLFLKKGLGKTSKILENHGDAISSSINSVTIEKANVLDELTNINKIASSLPSKIVDIWTEYRLDNDCFYAEVAGAVEKIEEINRSKLLHIQREVARAAYQRFVQQLYFQFKIDVQSTSSENKDKLLEQSIALLDAVSLNGCGC